MVSGHPSFPGQLLPRAIVPHEIPLGAINPGLFPPRQLTLSNYPWTSTPQTFALYEIPPGQ